MAGGGATGHDLHVDQHLSNIAIQYKPMGMIADVIAPIVPVAKQSDNYIIWDQADAFRVEDDKRAPGTEANKIERGVSSEQYFADNYALKMPLNLEDRENMDPVFIKEMREGRTQYIKSKLMLGWEYRLAMKCTSGSNVGSYATITSDWIEGRSGYSNPMLDCWTAIGNVQDATGYKPNRCIMGAMAWRYFRQHADAIAIVHGYAGKSGGTGVRYISRENMKAIFELDAFHVGETYYNTVQEGQSVSLSMLWGDNVLWYYAPTGPTTEEPSFMYSFRWTKPGLPNMIAERHPFDPKTKSEEIELGYYQDEKITAKNLAYLMTHVTSV